ncbi:MAG TPA: MarR family transcriptional regulator [Solirubrobacteraceae bacterium]|jgi:DNA-binding MarR family transcriptional regulator|nr:MarR family transcriptional regulator [Solirubrobacteraceae bacterium]
MQATGVSAGTSQPPARGELTRDMFALASYLMRRSNLRTFHTIAELDLTFTQIKALCAMDDSEDEWSVKGLAESMQVSLAAMSRAVDDLFERGFVDRRERPGDRRMKSVRLTDEGRAITSSLTQGRLAGIEEFLSTLDDQEAGALSGALELILEQRPEIAQLRPQQTTERRVARQ